MLKANLSSIKAAEIMLRCLHGTEYGADLEDRSLHMRGLIDRSINQVDVSTFLVRYSSDLVRGLFAFLCFEPLVNLDAPSATLCDAAQSGLEKALEFVCHSSRDAAISSREDLLKRCNLVDLLSFLHSRSLSTRTSNSQQGILACLSLLAQYKFTVEIRCGILCVLSSMMRAVPSDLPRVAKIFLRFTSTVLGIQDQEGSSYVIEYLYSELCAALLLFSKRCVLDKKPQLPLYIPQVSF